MSNCWGFLGMIKARGLPAPEPEYYFARPRQWRFDLAWPAVRPRLALEVEGGTWLDGGGRHNRGSGYEGDCEKYNEAALRGWRVLRATTRMVEDGRALALLERALGGTAMEAGERWFIRPCRGGHLIESTAGRRVVRGAGGIANAEDAALIAQAPVLWDTLDRLAEAVERSAGHGLLILPGGREHLAIVEALGGQTEAPPT